jgi:hypothetical protein
MPTAAISIGKVPYEEIIIFFIEAGVDTTSFGKNLNFQTMKEAQVDSLINQMKALVK